VRAKRAWELLQLGPTALRRGRLRHVAACEARSARLTARLGAGEGWLTGCLADGLQMGFSLFSFSSFGPNVLFSYKTN